MKLGCFPALALVLLSGAAAARAQGVGGAAVELRNAAKVARAARTQAAPVIDGRLDDPAWAGAPIDDRFVQVQPLEGQPPSERTEVQLLYDDRAVYVGVRCRDRNPSGIVARMTRRDRGVDTDTVAIGFDSQQDGRTGYVFQLSAAGVQTDGLLYDDDHMNVDWDAVWDGGVGVDASGWVAEFRIPLSVLRFGAQAQQDWGFQVVRDISRKKEKTVWAYRPTHLKGEVSWFGRVSGVSGLRPVRTFELRPFAVARLTGGAGAGGGFFGGGVGAAGDRRDLQLSPDVGVDAKLGLTSRLMLDATVNPDFGQVEADQVELNLSRFETFFPEKRPFFLEGADVYQTPVQLFYSRRIGKPLFGLSAEDELPLADGSEVTVVETPAVPRIWAASKLTGALTEDLSIGLLAAVVGAEQALVRDAAGGERELELAPERSFGVLRLRQSVGAGAYIGAMATAVNRLGDGEILRAEANHDAYTQGLDGFWNSGDGGLRLNGQLVLSQWAGGPGHHNADDRACTPSPADPTCLPITRLDGTVMGPGAFGHGGSGEMEMRRGHLLMDVEVAALSPRLDTNDAGFLERANKLDLDVVTGYLETRPRGWFQNFALLGTGEAERSWDGVYEGSELGVYGEALFRNYLYSEVDLSVRLPGWDIVETTDGGRFERSWGYSAQLQLSSDSRRMVQLSGQGWWFFSMNGGPAVGGHLHANLQPGSRLQLEIGPEFLFDYDTRRFYDCVDAAGVACHAGTEARHYRFAEQDSSFLSLTTRGTYTFTSRLTFQWYGQLFMARARYDHFREIDTIGTRPYIRRDNLRDSAFTGDGDGDGDSDQDFQRANLNLNAVLRWEFLPGSVFFAVYTRAQAASPDPAGALPRLSLRGLGRGETEDVFLLKLSYFVR